MMPGNELRKLRENLGLSVLQVVEMTKLSRPTVYAIENGQSLDKNHLYLEFFYEHYRYEKMLGGK